MVCWLLVLRCVRDLSDGRQQEGCWRDYRHRVLALTAATPLSSRILSCTLMLRPVVVKFDQTATLVEYVGPAVVEDEHQHLRSRMRHALSMSSSSRPSWGTMIVPTVFLVRSPTQCMSPILPRTRGARSLRNMVMVGSEFCCCLAHRP